MKIGRLDTYSDLELALMVLLDYFSSGVTRKSKLGKRYANVQALVNKIILKQSVPEGKGASIDKEHLRKVLDDMRPSSEDYDEYVSIILEKI